MDGGGCSQRVTHADRFGAWRRARATSACCLTVIAHGHAPVVAGRCGGWCWCSKVQV